MVQGHHHVVHGALGDAAAIVDALQGHQQADLRIDVLARQGLQRAAIRVLLKEGRLALADFAALQGERAKDSKSEL